MHKADSRFLERGFICKTMWVRGGGGLALLILSHFFKISHENETFGLTKTKLFHFNRIFKNGGLEGVHSNPLNPLWICQ